MVDDLRHNRLSAEDLQLELKRLSPEERTQFFQGLEAAMVEVNDRRAQNFERAFSRTKRNVSQAEG